MQSVSGSFGRIQFTPDLMPSDVIGYTVVDINTGKGSYKPGAAMCNFLLADEINRASPKVQSSLLEAMEELQISVDGETHQLPKPFMTLATQNPIETFGTYHLPEAQLDRFLMRISVGYPDRAAEMKMLEVMPQRQETQPVMSLEELMELRRQAAQVKVADNVKAYILSLVTATRFLQQVKLGASPRGSIAMFRAAQAMALMNGRDYATPDDVKAVAIPVLEKESEVTLAEIRCERIFALRERSSVLVQEPRCEKPVVAVESADYLDILPQERRAVHRGKDILGKSGNRHQCGAAVVGTSVVAEVLV